jgi:hypothetical protein
LRSNSADRFLLGLRVESPTFSLIGNKNAAFLALLLQLEMLPTDHIHPPQE